MISRSGDVTDETEIDVLCYNISHFRNEDCASKKLVDAINSLMNMIIMCVEQNILLQSFENA